jgi:16S rRNA processing protein RimM
MLPLANQAAGVWPEDAIEIGCIVDAWGLQGWFKVKPFSSDPQALFSVNQWFLKPSEKSRPQGLVAAPRRACIQVDQVKAHGELLVARSLQVVDRTAAEALRGSRIFVSRAQFPGVSIDEFYWVDLIGLSVVNRQGEPLGSVLGLLDAGPHSVLRVALAGGKAHQNEHLIPFVAAYIDNVSVAQRLISVDWGLDF